MDLRNILSDSSDDKVNSADFAVPVGPALSPSRKKCAVVVSMGQFKNVTIGEERGHSHSLVRCSLAAGQSAPAAKHQLPSSVAYDLKLKRGSEDQQGSKRS